MPWYVNMNYMRTSVHTKAEDAMPISSFFGWFVLCMCLYVVNDNLSCAVLCNNVWLSSLLPVACRRMGTTCVSLPVMGEMSSLKNRSFLSQREVGLEYEQSLITTDCWASWLKCVKNKRALNIFVIFFFCYWLTKLCEKKSVWGYSGGLTYNHRSALCI